MLDKPLFVACVRVRPWVRRVGFADQRADQEPLLIGRNVELLERTVLYPFRFSVL
jgi:hypothetical protein